MTLKIIKLPDIGEGVAEAEVVEWHVAVGDEIAEDQILAAVMTDKATVEIPSPVAGRIINLGGEVGTVLAVGAPLVGIDVFGEGGRAGNVSSDQNNESSAVAIKSGDAPQNEFGPGPERIPISIQSRGHAIEVARHASIEATKTANRTISGEKPVASPAVRGRALQAGVDLRQVRGTGPAGRISHEDLDDFMKEGRLVPAVRSVHDDRIETIKLVGLRRKIAEKMAESSRRIAHFSYIDEVDVTALEELRGHLNEKVSTTRPRLTILPFIVRAVTAALRDFPQMNAHYDDDAGTITSFGAAHVGIATQTSAGLMVPVLRNAQKMSLWDCAAEVVRLAEAARAGTVARDDLTGSTITITSLGELGGLATTPIINRPEVAIIGVNRMVMRPVWLNNQFVPRKIMNLSSSFDHRVIDGDGAARFIQAIKRLIELPATLFVEA